MSAGRNPGKMEKKEPLAGRSAYEKDMDPDAEVDEHGHKNGG